LYNRRILIRLVGVRLSGLVQGSPQISLFEDTGTRLELYAAMDRIRGRHGEDKVVRATTLDVHRRTRVETREFNGSLR
ncbi:MAG: DNA polymerase IV, partial [Bacteroidota bacterium]